MAASFCTDDVDASANVESMAKHKRFRPYAGATLDTPLFHFLISPVLPILLPLARAIYAIRWQLSRPLQIRVLPSFCPLVDIPLVKDLSFLTVGQIILTLPMLVLFLSGYYFAFVSPDIERSGHFAAYTVYATFLTANKSNSIASFVLGIPFERMIPFHNLASLITVTLSGFHGFVAYAYGEGGSSGDSSDRRLDSDDSQYGLMGSDPSLGKFLFDGTNNMSGSLWAISMLLLVITSVFPIIRRKFFDLWFWTHILAAICVVIFATMHEVTSILFLAVWWAIDLFTRYLVMAGCRYPHKATLELVTDDIVEVSFEKPAGFSYNSGQFVQIAFPDLGTLAFHPISISSAPHEPKVTLHVRALGNWSNRLVKLAKDNTAVPILLEGPYGSLSMDIDDDSRYKMVLLVSGGIGVTHCNSVAKSIIQDHLNGRKLKHLRFVWAVRNLDMIPAMTPLVKLPTPDLETDTCNYQASLDDDAIGTLTRVVETDIFLTKSSSASPIHLNDGRNLFFGRPDINAIVADVKEQALKAGVTHVAVFGCGPHMLVDRLKDVCRKHCQKVGEFRGVTFDVHEEIFDF